MNEDYAMRFGGVGRLYGRAALDRLQSAHVCVVGVGGVGSWTVEGLVRSGIGAVTMIDLDDVCVTNVNRQLHALEATIGQPKVAVLAERMRTINPACKVKAVMEYFTAAAAERLLSADFDYVIDAIDKVGNKALLISECHRRRLSVLTVGGAGGKRDLTRIRTGDLAHSEGDDLLRLVRKKLRREYGFPRGKEVRFGIGCVYSAEKPVYPWSDGSCQAEPEPGTNLTLDCASGFGTAVFVTGAFGFAAAGEVVRQIAGAVSESEISAAGTGRKDA